MFNALNTFRRFQLIQKKRLNAERYCKKNRLMPILRVKLKFWREVFKQRKSETIKKQYVN